MRVPLLPERCYESWSPSVDAPERFGRAFYLLCNNTMETLAAFVDLFLHLDKHLEAVIQSYGWATYLILFLIVFCETGLVVTPILPGDSLLFAAGALAARGGLNVHLLAALLGVAAILGDAVNYMIGSYLGPKAFQNPNSKILKREYLEKTQSFYEKYGGKTIVFARFVPIVRTFAPFLAGVGGMNYTKFGVYNVVGALLWILLFVYGGFFFGSLPIIKKNFTLVILGIIVVSILPAAIEAIRERRAARAATL
jgi:membrane-associated protein